MTMRPISRRTFVISVSALLAALLVALARKPGRVWRIGFLTNGTVASAGGQLEAFERGLAEQGYVVGRNVVVESRWAEGKIDRLPALVDDLLAQKIDLLFAPSGLAAQAAKKSGTTVPIVFAFAPDPVGQGFGASLSRPGGTMTGLTSTHTELSAKRISLLMEAFPSVRRIAVLYFLTGSAAGVAEQLAETERAAKILGIALVTEESPRPEDFERAFASIQKQRPDALIVIENPMFYTNRVRVTQLAASLRIPAIYNVREWAEAGGLMSYGASYADLARRAAAHAVKILNGAAPGELPIERPTKLELVINRTTAGAIGVTIPPSVLLRADDVIG
jgi:putative tryptophan/tyrosine transport system substrate-binding protein